MLPNFAAFDVKNQIVHGIPVPATDVGLTLLYGAVYIALLMAASVVIFSRRDFK